MRVEFDVPPFKAGMEAEVRFYVPSLHKHTSFNLIKDDNNYMIHGALRWDKKVLVLNSKSGGSWGSEIHAPIDFKLNDDVAIRFTARDDHFVVYVNGQEKAQFKYRLPLSDIKKATTIPAEGLELISYSVHFG